MLTNSTELDRVAALSGSHEIPIHYKKIVNINARTGTIIVNFGGYNSIIRYKKYTPPMINTDGNNFLSSNLLITDHTNTVINVALIAPGLRRLAKKDGSSWCLPQTFAADMYVEIQCGGEGNIAVAFDQFVN